MSVLIKGITLEQFYRDLNNVRDMDVGWDAVQLPPHGRLIDADALMENEENISFKDEWHMTVTEAFVSVKNIAHAPTIIEAEEGE